MGQSLSYHELQQKFCEGFAFLPLESLMQHGNFIYKCYSPDTAVPAVLQQHTQHLPAGCIHACIAVQKLKRTDNPAAGHLLCQLAAAEAVFTHRARVVPGSKELFRQLAGTINAYSSTLTIFEHSVLHRLPALLSPLASGERQWATPASAENIGHVKLMIREFLKTTDTMISFLQHMAVTPPDTTTLILLQAEKKIVEGLSKDILEFSVVLEKTDYVLEQLKSAIIRFYNQHKLN